MGVAERREREREQLRQLIVEAARDLLLEQGLSGLSMRSIAERIEYSPATIYLYFESKEELVRAVVRTGFDRLSEVVVSELSGTVAKGDGAAQFASMGRAYAKFAVANPAYFRVMFELPGTPDVHCGAGEAEGEEEAGLGKALSLVRRAVEEDGSGALDPRRRMLLGWGLIHGLTSLYLSGHLVREAAGPEAFLQLVEEAMRSIYEGRGRTPAGGVAA